MSSELQSLITVSLTIPSGGPLPAGTLKLGVWDERTGGDPKSTVTLHRPGGMGPQDSYTSLPTYDPVVVTRVFDNEKRSDAALYKSLLPYFGKAPGSVIEQPLDSNGLAFGDPTTYSGRLEDGSNGTVNSESEAARMWSLTFVITNVS